MVCDGVFDAHVSHFSESKMPHVQNKNFHINKKKITTLSMAFQRKGEKERERETEIE